MNQTLTNGFVIWFTGLPASGKTTLAKIIKEQLSEQGIRTVLLDSNNLRTVLTPQPTYTESERNWFYNVITQLAALLSEDGINVLIAATAHHRSYRERARQQIGRFAEVHIHCALQTCQERDLKGIYALAESGEAVAIPGVGADFEQPLHPEAAVDTTNTTGDHAAQIILAQLQSQNLIP